MGYGKKKTKEKGTDHYCSTIYEHTRKNITAHYSFLKYDILALLLKLMLPN